jgi:hypothetical protein
MPAGDFWRRAGIIMMYMSRFSETPQGLQDLCAFRYIIQSWKAHSVALNFIYPATRMEAQAIYDHLLFTAPIIPTPAPLPFLFNWDALRGESGTQGNLEEGFIDDEEEGLDVESGDDDVDITEVRYVKFSV